MIVVIRKRNFFLIVLVFILLVTVYSLNFNKDRAETVANENISVRTVILDPGHGGEDPGAVSDYSGLKEKDANLSIALYTKQFLEEGGYKVLMTREEDKLCYENGAAEILEKRYQDLKRRKKMMDEAGADIVVSIHLNKFPQSKYFGAQTFYPPNSTESRELAVAIQKSLREIVDKENKREALVRDKPIIILKDLKTPTVVVECGFLSNREEEQKLSDPEYQKKLAEAIKAGIDEYFKRH